MVISQVDLFIDDCESAFVRETIEKRWLSEGLHTKLFMEDISEKLENCFSFPVPNGTLGLFLAFLALDLEPKSEVIIPSFTFYASAMAAVYAGLTPVFVDVHPKTFNVTPQAIAAAITPRTRAIMPVHIYGHVCDMNAIMEIAYRHDLKVIEDAAQAFSATLCNRPAGLFGDIGVFSFYSDKVITTGEGGCLVTHDQAIADKIALIRNQGRPHSGTFVHPSLGMNFRITDMQAAVGRSQLRKLPQIIADRLQRWDYYSTTLAGVGDLEFMEVFPESTLVPFRFPILTNERVKISAALEAEGMQTRGFFYPLHLQPKLKREPPQSLVVSEDLHRRGLCLPIHHHLTNTDLERIVSTIHRYFHRA
jgi:perosamine synthetase